MVAVMRYRQGPDFHNAGVIMMKDKYSQCGGHRTQRHTIYRKDQLRLFVTCGSDVRVCVEGWLAGVH